MLRSNMNLGELWFRQSRNLSGLSSMNSFYYWTKVTLVKEVSLLGFQSYEKKHKYSLASIKQNHQSIIHILWDTAQPTTLLTTVPG